MLSSKDVSMNSRRYNAMKRSVLFQALHKSITPVFCCNSSRSPAAAREQFALSVLKHPPHLTGDICHILTVGAQTGLAERSPDDIRETCILYLSLLKILSPSKFFFTTIILAALSPASLHRPQ